jgi:protoheme IX farnesyltransferase
MAVRGENYSFTFASRIGVLARAYLELIKFRITFFVGMSAVFGAVLASTDISARVVFACVGIFLLSCASAAMNHYQERRTDSMMHRTMRRPLPSGTVLSQHVLLTIGVLSIVGSFFITVFGGFTALLLSWCAFFSYNLVYTPLKRVTPFAVIPGSFVGAFPVMAGWAAASSHSSIFAPEILLVAFYFFVWQIPHFLLLMSLYASDYERGGFPTLDKYFKGKGSSTFIFFWILLLIFVSFFFYSSNVISNLVVQLVVVALGLWLAGSTYSILKGTEDNRVYKLAFMKINIYVLTVTVMVMVDRVLSLI